MASSEIRIRDEQASVGSELETQSGTVRLWPRRGYGLVGGEKDVPCKVEV
jgi:hypothetical protein